MFSFLSSRRSSKNRTRSRFGFERLEDRCTPTVGTPFTIADNAGQPPTPTETISELDSASTNNFAVAVWTHSDGNVTTNSIKARLYNADGTARTAEFTVIDSVATESNPTVAMDDAGRWVVAFERLEPNSTQKNLWFARYNADGVRLGNNTVVAATSVDESQPSIAADSAGNFVIAYTRATSTTNNDVQFRRYAANGVFQGAGAVSALADVNERLPEVARAGNSEFVVAFLRNDAALIRKFSAAGAPLWIRTGVANGASLAPSAAMDAQGAAILGFTFGNQVFMKRFNAQGGFGPLIQAEPPGTVANITPAVGLDRAGTNFVVGYSRSSPLGHNIIVKEYGTTRTFQTTVNRGTLPNLTVNANGTYFLTWISAANDIFGSVALRGVFGTISV